LSGLYKKVPYLPKVPPLESIPDDKIQKLLDYIGKNKKKTVPANTTISPQLQEEYDNWFAKF
jgi:hypothetical protein